VCNVGSNTVSVFDATNPSSVPTTVDVGQTPSAIAIAFNKYACVCNEGSRTVSVFDVTHPPLPPKRAPSVNVGHFPVAIAIANNKYACVCNSGDNTVTVFDVTSLSTAPTTFAVGLHPIAIAVLSPPQEAPLVEPPPLFTGVIHRHGGNGTLEMRWRGSLSPNIASYEIFAGDELLTSISASTSYSFSWHLDSPYLSKKKLPHKYIREVEKKYRIRAVNADGIASPLKHISIEK
jgi:hypothetical protein